MVNFPIHIDTISMGQSIVQLKGSKVEFSKLWYFFLFLNAVLILANIADPDEMQHTAFHLGLHYLQTYSFRGFHYKKS